MNQNTGHGHVYPRPDGVKARCGGPAICSECATDFARQQAGASAGAVSEVGQQSPLPASKERSLLSVARSYVYGGGATFADLEEAVRSAVETPVDRLVIAGVPFRFVLDESMPADEIEIRGANGSRRIKFGMRESAPKAEAGYPPATPPPGGWPKAACHHKHVEGALKPPGIWVQVCECGKLRLAENGNEKP